MEDGSASTGNTDADNEKAVAMNQDNTNTNTNTNTNANCGSSTGQTKESSLPPPNISRDEIDRLLNALLMPTDQTASEKSSPPYSQKLAGREVLIPAFGTGVAFFEGELRPKTRAKAVHGSGSSSSKNDEEEEMVCISTAPQTNCVAGQRASAQKQKPNNASIPTNEDLVSVSLSDALDWLRKHSSFANSEIAGSTVRKPGPPAKESPQTPAPKVTTAKPKPTAAGKPKPEIPNANTTTAKATNIGTGTSTSTEHSRMDEVSPIMFNINEEYDEHGKRVYGEAVNLSSRLQAVYGDASPSHSDTNYSEEKDDSTGGGPTSTSMHAKGEENMPAAKKKKKVVSDEEYDKISRRLEELALLEEEEAKRKKQMRSSPKTLGSTSKKTAASSSSSSSSSFGFKKGFLNSTKRSSPKKKSPPAVAKSTTNATTLKSMPTTSTPKPNGSEDPVPKIPSGGVTINTSKNQIHEIPREGRQQPLPQRNTQQQQQQQQQIAPLPSTHNATASSTRLLDSSVFSGHISERPAVPSSSSSSSSSAISAETAARLAANEQTQSLQHELAQHEQQMSSKPRRVSRFKQQRQQEQDQRPKRVSRFKQQREQQQ
eukprot:jgi/Psemu1/22888/gm1.22888_g